MKRFHVTPRAIEDLDAIADYTLQIWGARQTEKYLAELQQRFEWLGNNPQAGRARDEIRDGFRSYPHGSHVIFYVIHADFVAIIGVPHGSLDIEAYFDQPD